MKNEFVLAFNEVLEEKQLPRDVILKALESAMVSAYRRAVNASNAQQVEAKVDLDTGKVTIYAEKEVVEQVREPLTEVSLEEARRYNPHVQLGDMIVVESTPRDFGRVAAQTARQVIQQRIRDAERQMQLNHYAKQVGEIVSGVVQAVNAQGLTIGLEMRAEGTMPRKEMIPGERFRIHDRVRALVAEVKDNNRGRKSYFRAPTAIFCAAFWKTKSPKFTTAWWKFVRLPENRVNVPRLPFRLLKAALTRWEPVSASVVYAFRPSSVNCTMKKLM